MMRCLRSAQVIIRCAQTLFLEGQGLHLLMYQQEHRVQRCDDSQHSTLRNEIERLKPADHASVSPCDARATDKMESAVTNAAITRYDDFHLTVGRRIHALSVFMASSHLKVSAVNA